MSSETKEKVLVVTSTYPRWSGDVEPAFVGELTDRLSKYYDMTVLAPYTERAKLKECKSESNRVIRFKYTLWGKEIAYNGGISANLKKDPSRWLVVPLFLLAEMLAIFRFRKGIKLAHVHWVIPQGIAIALLKAFFLKKMKLIITSHGSDINSFQSGPLRAIKRWAFTKADMVTVVSEDLKHKCVALGVDSKRVVVAPMGTDMETLFIRQDSVYRRQRGVVFVGRLIQQKGGKLLLEAFSMLVSRLEDISLTIVGDGPELSELRALASKKGILDKVTFTGALPSSKVSQQLNKNRVAVFPSLVEEGFGLAIVEAMACECAVVASDFDAVRDIVSTPNVAKLVPPGDHELLAAQLEELLENEALSTSLGKHARDLVLQKFSWDKAEERFYKLYKLLLNK